MLLWDVLSFIYNRVEVNTRMKKLIEKPGVGFL